MATVNKDFKIKSGLIVEGTTATVNGYDILTKKQGDQDYIVNLIGGTATSDNTVNTVVKRDASGDFAAGTITTTALYVGGSTDNGIDVVNGDTELGSNNGILLSANDDITLATSGGDVVLNPDGGAYLFSASSNNEIQTKVSVDGAITTALSTAQGYADAVAGDLSDHEALSAGVHGVTGSVVGTTDTQDLSNKRFIDTTYFTDGVTISNEGQIAVLSPSHEFEVKANVGPLGLKSYNDDIVLTPGSGKDVKWGADVVATESYADTAEQNAKDYADDLAGNYDASGSAATAEGNAKDYTDTLLGDATIDGTGGNTVTARIATAVADLVDGAPALLDTLNELAAAIGDNVDAQGLATAIGNKLPLAGGSMSGAIAMGTNKITGLGTPTANADAATKGYVDGEISTLDTAAQGYASGAYQDAVDYADALTTTDIAEGSNQYFTNQRALDATASAYDAAGTAAGLAGNYDAAGTAQDIVDALTTSDIEEGSNSYFTDSRAKESAADLLTGASLTNITITGTGAGLTITAENGVADSNTNQLAEGTDQTGAGGVNNLYFTNTRVIDAIAQAQEISPQVININWARREEATWTPIEVASKVSCHNSGTYAGTMKYIVRVITDIDEVQHSHATEILATVTGTTNVAMVEYGTIYTSENPLATVTVEWNDSIGGYDLNVTTANNYSEVMVVATLIAVQD